MSLPNVVERWVDVFQGSLDLDEYLDLFSDDVLFRDGQTGQTTSGKTELATFVRPFTQLSDISASVLGYAVNKDTVFLEGELKAKAPTGDPVVSRGVGVFTVAGPKISSFAMYMFRQNVEL